MSVVSVPFSWQAPLADAKTAEVLWQHVAACNGAESISESALADPIPVGHPNVRSWQVVATFPVVADHVLLHILLWRCLVAKPLEEIVSVQT